MNALLEANGLTKRFTVGRKGFRKLHLAAVTDVSLSIHPGETLSLVGESGSGKSTTGLMIARLLEPDAGSLMFDDRDLLAMRGAELRRERQRFQMIFQDPFTSLNPRMTVEEIVAEPVRVQRSPDAAARREIVMHRLEQVGLGNPTYLDRRPREFSGGQRQRIAIARALVFDPKLVIADEVVAALDVSTQSGVVNLLQDLQESLGMAMLFISHDLSVVRHVSDRIAVMYRGRIVETGPSEVVCSEPLHPYTRALLSSVLRPDPAVQRARLRIPIRASVDETIARGGCAFAGRCPNAIPVCSEVLPPPIDVNVGHTVACHLFDGPDSVPS